MSNVMGYHPAHDPKQQSFILQRHRASLPTYMEGAIEMCPSADPKTQKTTSKEVVCLTIMVEHSGIEPLTATLPM
ncbi:hypothetical protein [Brevibacillus choshinensis]|uniref:hypothetical protein n=1 Tax=Brevibacillus choshinensis TaxID=54911 RepID=UPI00128ECFD7|nr:hypothetical protein [Brevibacillus choshinensis]